MQPYNPMHAVDAYKLDHRRQYPPGTTRVYSNWTPRGSRLPGVDKVVFFGLQAFLNTFLSHRMHVWFKTPKEWAIAEYQEFLDSVLGPNQIGTDHIAALHDLGYVPLRFCALPEGTAVPLRVPMFTVENTLPEFFWLVNYFETAMSAALWQPMTSATQAYRLRQLLDERAAKSGGPALAVNFQGHDFSMRGMAGIEAAAGSGAGHLLSFTGTDTMSALEFIRANYRGGTFTDRDGTEWETSENGFIGGSVAATEHSVMCAGGDLSERETYDRLLELYPTGIVSVVSDTWDYWNVLTNIVPSLKDKIMARDGKLVIRPDSGDPADIVCGSLIPESIGMTHHYPAEERPFGTGKTPEEKGTIELLWETFGGTVNEMGFKELDPHIGVIYGDSINYDRAEEITRRLMNKGFASTNIVFGVGSFTYQYTTRDTFNFAMKATWAEVDGEGRDLFKDPVTDKAGKKSAKGRLAVLEDADTGELELFNQATPALEERSHLVPVWEDGKFLRRQSFNDVRKILKAQ